MVNSIKQCFEWMGGKPKELVFDQDRLIAVDENYSDIIYTKEFEAFRQSEKLKIYLCRGADPESKGRVEAVVKFFKNNFAKYRPYSELWQWEEEFEQWLSRCGNRKKHSMTKKIPAEVFEVEREYLTPISYENNNIIDDNILTRTVRKDNTVFYLGNRYSVPLGTYNLHKEVTIEIKGNELWIYDVFRDTIFVKHKISLEKGRLIQNNNHLRNTEDTIKALQQKFLDRLIATGYNGEKSLLLLEGIRREKPRYVRDQYRIIEKTIEEMDKSAISAALEFCTENELYSAVDFKDAAAYFKKLAELVWLENAYNIMFLEPPGLGKTRLSIGLGIKAIETGYNVAFVTLDQLMQLLKTAEIRMKSNRRIKQIKSSDLVILDEVGFLPISRQEVNKLYEFINELYMKTSIILTSNKGFEEWSEFLVDSVITAAILDRLAHQCEIFTLEGPSWHIENRKTILKKDTD